MSQTIGLIIDGLRALAVVAYHAFLGVARGGFLEIDIFLVISGFLIFGIILEDPLLEKFSFVSFYSRRIRRIFPALLLLLFASVLIFG